jgi:hypothetical protein
VTADIDDVNLGSHTDDPRCPGMVGTDLTIEGHGAQGGALLAPSATLKTPSANAIILHSWGVEEPWHSI